LPDVLVYVPATLTLPEALTIFACPPVNVTFPATLTLPEVVVI